MSSEKKTQNMGRRQFLGATAAGLSVMSSHLVRGSAANSAPRLGLLGCGGRGTGVASGFVKDTSARVTALADLFSDRLEKAHQHFDRLNASQGHSKIDNSQLFQGPDAAQELAASNQVDFVLIATPPYVHPEHLEIVVRAGKHAYLEKPVSVDVAGAKKVMELGEKAHGKLSLDVGFQIRNAPPFVELTRRIHDGALGKIACGQAYYYAGALDRPAWPGASPAESRLRNWVWDKRLSGDIIVEQNIHVIDVCNWVLRGHPVKASGEGGRSVRMDSGDCYDHYGVTFTYPDDVNVSFSSTQFNKGWWDVCERFFGSKGVSEAHYSQPVAIFGEEPWDYFQNLAKSAGETEFSAAGSFGGALDEADPEKQKAFVESILSGNYHNQAAQGAESALSAMLGRQAAYERRVVTWDELVASDEAWDPQIDIRNL